MFAPKPISPDSIACALTKAERYRLLNEPGEAESICRDILEIDPRQAPEIEGLGERPRAIATGVLDILQSQPPPAGKP